MLPETCLVLGERFVEAGQLDSEHLELGDKFVTQGLKINPELALLLELKVQVSALKAQASASKAQALKDKLLAATVKAQTFEQELLAEDEDAKAKAATKIERAVRKVAEGKEPADREASEKAAEKGKVDDNEERAAREAAEKAAEKGKGKAGAITKLEVFVIVLLLHIMVISS
jgi:hypothetical protein